MKGKKRHQAPPAEEPRQEPAAGDPAERMVHWVTAKRRPLSLGMGVLIVVTGGLWFMQSAQSRREAFASSEFDQARFAVQTGNLALAASDLGSIVSSYGGTLAASEASILLARVHLMQGAPDLAVSELRTFIAQSPPDQFLAPASALLGSALEDLGQYGEASVAYEEAADVSAYELVMAEFLIDAGRTATLAGDVERAAGMYRRVLDETDEPQVLSEVRLRLAEVENTPARP